MVLHNSKWDKKATRNYQRKHGIKPGYGKQEDVSLSEEEEEEGERSDVSEENEGDPERPRHRKLVSNAWRYQDVGSSEPVDDQPLDIDFRKLDLKNYSDFGRKKTDFSKMSEAELLEWSLQATPKDDKSHIRELNQKETDEWNQMKDKAASVKLQNEMKMKFSGEKKRAKVLELSLSGDHDNYRNLVDRKFDNTMHKDALSDTELEADLLELVGEKKDEQSTVDLDDLMKAPVERTITKQTSSVPLTKKIDATESQKFLDDLLD